MASAGISFSFAAADSTDRPLSCFSHDFGFSFCVRTHAVWNISTGQKNITVKCVCRKSLGSTIIFYFGLVCATFTICLYSKQNIYAKSTYNVLCICSVQCTPYTSQSSYLIIMANTVHNTIHNINTTGYTFNSFLILFCTTFIYINPRIIFCVLRKI